MAVITDDDGLRCRLRDDSAPVSRRAAGARQACRTMRRTAISRSHAGSSTDFPPTPMISQKGDGRRRHVDDVYDTARPSNDKPFRDSHIIFHRA